MPLHIAVLPGEILHHLDPQPGQVIVDATIGAGGHAALLVDKVGPAGQVIGVDQDPQMLRLAEQMLEGKKVALVHGSFEDLPEILQKMQISAVDGILADLGFCSDQLNNPERGLSKMDRSICGWIKRVVNQSAPWYDVCKRKNSPISFGNLAKNVSVVGLLAGLWKPGKRRR